MEQEQDRFYEKWHVLHDVAEAQQLLDWDQQVMMPPLGAEQRSRQLAALARLAHGLLVDRELGDLIAALEARSPSGLSPEAAVDLAADLREARRARDRAVRVPAVLVAERARVCSLAQVAWAQAREADDFAAFLPHLREVLRLTRDLAVAIASGGSATPYDALLDEYEPGMTEAELSPLFTDLRERLVRLLERIRGAPRRPRRAVLRRHYPRAAQEVFCRRLVADLGFNPEAGRLDVSVHPFTSGTLGDVRITTRYDERFLSRSLFGAIHEAGHAIYEQGLDPRRYRAPAGQACSLGIHESQSRFWENLIGRSRPFWTHYLPLLREAFPGALDDVSIEEFYRAINTCEASFIRVEADEVTYNLHIVLRFELESAMLAGSLEAADLPGAWTERMGQLLGCTPERHRDGVLQDVHWSAGLIGYFPTYALGNLYAAQLMEQLRRELPDLDSGIARGELSEVKRWLNRNVHAHGRRYLAPELCRRITGAPLAATAALSYLESKYGEIYGF